MADLLSYNDPIIDTQLERYLNDLKQVTRQALEGELDEREFRTQMKASVRAGLIILFLLGGATPDQLETNEEFLEAVRINDKSVDTLADDIFSGRYSPVEDRQTVDEGQEKLDRRLILWAFAAAAMYDEGLLVAPRDSNLVWRIGNTENHCRDCLALNGKVLTREEWQRLGIRPKSPDLECRGYYCDCRRVETNEPSVGLAGI